MIVTFNPDLAARMRLMAYHGINRNVPNSSGVKRWWSYEVVAPGFKDNMTDIQAAIGVEQLKLTPFALPASVVPICTGEALNEVPGVRAPVLRHRAPRRAFARHPVAAGRTQDHS